MKAIQRFADNFARHCDIYLKGVTGVDEIALTKMVQFYKGEYSKDFLKQQLAIEYTEYSMARELIKGKLISFSASLAGHIAKNADNYMRSVDYRIPFPTTVIHFDKPLSIQLGDENESIEALLLFQVETTPEIAKRISEDDFFERSKLLTSLGLKRPELSVGKMSNAVIAVFAGERRAIRKISWQGGVEECLYQIDYERTEKSIADGWNAIRQLAVACVGYINCENVYLYTEEAKEDAKEKAKRKAPKGRPYYTCRIRGVNYDNPVGTGKGTSPGHIFDVRGHFRRLDSGKVTWVRPHLRGLKSGGEYVPKVYTVGSSS